MSSLVTDLQQEILNSNCDILIALRKAHLIASKLQLNEYDKWIQSELNGYDDDSDNIPDYRQVNGQVKAWNPYNGWIPVILQNSKLEKVLCNQKLGESIGEILDLYNKSSGIITITFSADVANKLDSWCDVPFKTQYALHFSKHLLKSIIDKVTNCLLEWTLELEKNGILGENMTFSKSESASAKELSQQINNYYGPVVNGNLSNSQMVSGNNNAIAFNELDIPELISTIRKSLETETISKEDMETALEILDDVYDKFEKKKKPSIIKSALLGLRDFIISAGANITAALITAQMQGL